MSPRPPRSSPACLLLWWWLSGCAPPEIGSPCSLSGARTPEERAEIVRACSGRFVDVVDVEAGVVQNLDILFLIDNSPSMSPKQKALAENIPHFMDRIEASGANYHIGIATSDIGSWTAPKTPWTSPLGTCNSFEGDDGLLQRAPCTARTGVTKEAFDACQKLCPDPGFVPRDGTGFISKVGGVSNVPVSPDQTSGKDLGPLKAFQCLALTGDNGCGVEGQLEGARRALDGHNPGNADFLRQDSILVVIFITDEDDCSVALSRRAENDPTQMDCPVPDKEAAGSCFNPDYRCMARDVVCQEPLNTTGLKSGCQERPGSYLEDLDTYVRFFTGLRAPSKLVVSGIWPPSLAAGGKFDVTYTQTGKKSYDLNRGEGSDAACVNARDPGLFGRPQLRLSSFLSHFPNQIEVSVCETDQYASALDSVANAIKNKLGASCLPILSGGQKPECLVGEVDESAPGSIPDTLFPECGAQCCTAWSGALTPSAEDPRVKEACKYEPAAPCYCAVPSSTIQGVCLLGSVWRRPGTLPSPGKVVKFTCASQ